MKATLYFLSWSVSWPPAHARHSHKPCLEFNYLLISIYLRPNTRSQWHCACQAACNLVVIRMKKLIVKVFIKQFIALAWNLAWFTSIQCWWVSGHYRTVNVNVGGFQGITGQQMVVRNVDVILCLHMTSLRVVRRHLGWF